MTNPEIAEKAEQLTRRRARMMPFLAMIFLIQQISYFSGTQGERAVDHVKIGAWLILAIVLLVGLGTGGAWLQPKAVRDLANDETTRLHRSRAIEIGFWTMAGTLIGLYVVSLFEQLGGRDAVHLTLTAGIGASLLMFGFLERRALRGE